jgi:hypothetical protein
VAFGAMHVPRRGEARRVCCWLVSMIECWRRLGRSCGGHVPLSAEVMVASKRSPRLPVHRHSLNWKVCESLARRWRPWLPAIDQRSRMRMSERVAVRKCPLSAMDGLVGPC